MTKKILSSVAGIALGAAALIGGTASPAAAISGCSKTASTDHSVSVRCTSGLETYFRVYGYFCSTSSCSYIPGGLVYKGSTSKATSGAYYSGKWYVKGCYVTDGC
ncbi:hypothetical protein HTZ77_41960 [Nonomuraea sp. SMC257]|uniref:Uncharacterized protein n=1 Tax=Nonomuraea montanisoli TaxID=2741721 RepID=A0A7Y6IGP2_9ACTN|nr:hypothetical protein [Nonomuraea montanisoli]NUW37919.1 hypothetical protein [Nonomuraea montanisoli]